jgi:hypothetical protein
MPVSSILLILALVAFIVQAVLDRPKGYGWVGLALLTAAQLFYGK